MSPNTPAKRPRSQPAAAGNVSKKSKSSRSSKPQQQQLISRFFTSTPVQNSQPKSKKSQSQSPAKKNRVDDEGKEAKKQDAPLLHHSTDSTEEGDVKNKSNSHSTVKKLYDDEIENDKNYNNPDNDVASSEKMDEGPTQDTDEAEEETISPPVTRRRRTAQQKPRVTHRIVLDSDADSEEECTRASSKQSKRNDTDDDFIPDKSTLGDDEDDDEDDDDDDDDDMVVDEKEDQSDENIDDDGSNNNDCDDANTEDNENPKRSVKSRKRTTSSSVPASSITLESYALNRDETDTSAQPVPLPRDEKRRKRLTDKVGRMEVKNLFQRGGSTQNTEIQTADKNALLQVDNAKSTRVTGKKKGGRTGTKYTPLETQYIALRDKHPGLVLIVECGYKYRLFDRDATTASSVLRIVSYMDHNFLTASFPTCRLAYHVRRLVDAGHKVGVVSQAETAALKRAGDTASKLFERTLSAVYSKGTIVADGTLAATVSTSAAPVPASYIMAVRDVIDPSKKVNNDGSDSNGRIGIALAAVDCATGQVVHDAFIDDVLRSELDARLVSIEPVEIVMLPPSITTSGTSKRTNGVLRAYAENASARIEYVSDESEFSSCDEISEMNESVLAAMNNQQGLLCTAVQGCIGALLRYLRQFKLDLTMRSVTEYKLFRTRRHMKVGADVLRNFEVFGNSNTGTIDGSLISLVNRTRTSFGSRQMRQWLSRPLVDPRDISARLDAVSYLRPLVDGVDAVPDSNDVAVAVAQTVAALAHVPDLQQGITRMSCEKSSPSELIGVLDALERTGRIIDRLKSLTPGPDFPELLKKILDGAPLSNDILDDPLVRVLNRSAVEKNELHLLFAPSLEVCNDEEDEIIRESLIGMGEEGAEFMKSIDEVSEANSELKSSLKAMDKLLKKLRERYSSPKWEWKKVAQEEFLLEVPTARASRMPKSWTIISQTKAVKRFRPEEAISGHDRVLRAREVVDAASTRCWTLYLRVFGSIATRLRAFVRALMDIDCLAALARVANSPDYCRPIIDMQSSSNDSGIHAVDARHALSELLPSCTSYVPNDVALGCYGQDSSAVTTDSCSVTDSANHKEKAPSTAKAVVISGPNYGGKSSYARMTALLILLAQIGSYVPARAMRIRPFDAIYARMGAADCIAKGLSSLMVELAETSRIFMAASSRSLVVMDELGRGTSTHDGSAIAYATLQHLVSRIRCVTLFVTHYPMVAQLADVYPRDVQACYMDYREEDDDESAEDEGENNEKKQCRRKKITLLYKLTQGVASSSYGVNVARLAGLPSNVLNEALTCAAGLESKMERTRTDVQYARMLGSETWRTGEDIRKLFFLKSPKGNDQRDKYENSQ